MGSIIIMIILSIPFILTGWNIWAIAKCLELDNDRSYHKVIEIAAMLIGAGYVFFYTDFYGLTFEDWSAQLYSGQYHSVISPDASVTILVLSLISFLGYLIIRFMPVSALSPIVAVVGISTLYIGIGLCVLWCVQMSSHFFLMLLPANCFIIFIKTIYIIVRQKHIILQNGETTNIKCSKLLKILNKTIDLPFMALILVLPLLGIIIIILLLFGQEPASIIKAWTETADWTLSQKIPPQNIPYDAHYLCTTAAGGHRKVVKPLRTGMRHGHRVVVNRQLCIANAFEQVIEEKLPTFHKIIRTIYDKTGYPVSKHIHSKYLADVIYILMKPLEWIFLLVLYTAYVNPENRIAVQYPHAPLPLEKLCG